MFVVDKKRNQVKDQIRANCTNCENGCNICLKKMQFVDKLADANIPAKYWFLKLSQFNGPTNLYNVATEYVANIDKNYNDGKGLCLLGQYGTGKTYSICSILKHTLINGYEAYYTSLTDMVNYLSSFETGASFYKLVTQVDFLAIDEVDSRHFSDSEQAQQYFGSNFERVIRYRSQNNLPLLLASNNASLEEVFTGQFRRVIDSLSSQSMQIVPVLGKDYRKLPK